MMPRTLLARTFLLLALLVLAAVTVQCRRKAAAARAGDRADP